MASSFSHTSSLRRASARFGDRDIHVWSARLDLPAERVALLERSLSAEERERGPRRRLARAVLRHVLAEYVDVAPTDLSLVGGTDQKPRLSTRRGTEELHFNVSHSADTLLIGLGMTAYLGIDVERLRPVPRAGRIARRAFTENERKRIAALSPELRSAAFFNCWTRKEACVKALGHGVWSAFNRWQVSVEPDEPARVLVADGNEVGAESWSLYHLEPAPGYVGALAVRGTDWRLEAWTLDPEKAAR